MASDSDKKFAEAASANRAMTRDELRAKPPGRTFEKALRYEYGDYGGFLEPAPQGLRPYRQFEMGRNVSRARGRRGRR